MDFHSQVKLEKIEEKNNNKRLNTFFAMFSSLGLANATQHNATQVSHKRAYSRKSSKIYTQISTNLKLLNVKHTTTTETRLLP